MEYVDAELFRDAPGAPGVDHARGAEREGPVDDIGMAGDATMSAMLADRPAAPLARALPAESPILRPRACFLLGLQAEARIPIRLSFLPFLTAILL